MFDGFQYLAGCEPNPTNTTQHQFASHSVNMRHELLLLGALRIAATAAFAVGGGHRVFKATSLHAEKPPVNVVIVGGGIGGLSTAFDATHLLGKDAQVTVVSDRPDFTFVPSNPWVAIGKRKPSDIQLPLTSVLPRHGINFVESKVTSLDPKRKKLHLKNGQEVTYDYLVIATGPKLAFDAVPGLKEYGLSVCTTPHAVHAYDAFQKLVQDPGPVVVGATQGASCFGPAYEYAMLLQNELKQRGGKALVDQCPVSFVTSEPWIGHMGISGAGNSEKFVSSLFSAHHMQAYTNARLKRVNKDSVVVEQVDATAGKLMGTMTLPSKLSMFIPPFEGLDIWKSVPGLTDSKGLILTNDFMQSRAYPDIFGVGVCVHLDAYESTPVPVGIPKTGYMIESMGSAVVKNIQRLCSGESDLRSKPAMNAVCIADFGHTGAIFVTLPQIPPRHHDYTYTGKLATLAKIAFERYFLHKIESGDCDPYYEKYMLKLIGVERTETAPFAAAVK